MPSTLANVMDLLSDYSNTVAVNSNISMLYIVYQVALMIATLVGPGTVLMMIAGQIRCCVLPVCITRDNCRLDPVLYFTGVYYI